MTEKNYSNENLDENDNLSMTFWKDRSIRLAVVIVAIGLCSILWYSLQSADSTARSRSIFVTTISIFLVIAGASFLSGGLVGFLFGIPRKLQSTDEFGDSEGDVEGATTQSKPSARMLYGGNTNLEQISDWLTKILVGVGLTQIGEIGTALDKVGLVTQSELEGVAGAKLFSI